MSAAFRFASLADVPAILAHQLYRVLAGKVSDEELVMVKESEEQAELEQLQKELAERDRREAELAAQTKK